jgi:endo-1,3(4)-beta-glucanase
VVNNGPTSADVGNINAPIATNAPPSQFASHPHPVSPRFLSGADLQNPIETNKWWGGIVIPGAEHTNLWAFPYSLWWTNSTLPGMNIQHIEASQRAFDTAHSPPQYYLNPLDMISWNMGATEFDSQMQMALDTPTQFTLNAKMSPSSGDGVLTIPLVQGMGFITGIYDGLTPLLSTSGKAIIEFKKSAIENGHKYKIGFNDGRTWLVYVFSSAGTQFTLSQVGQNLQGSAPFNGYIQIAKIPPGNNGEEAEATYDQFAGTYVTEVELFGSTSGTTGTYGYKFTTSGVPKSGALQFAFPHHVASFDGATQGAATGIYLQSTTMGIMQAYSSSTWTMTETLPNDVTFLPGNISADDLSDAALAEIRSAAEKDVRSAIACNVNSQYYGGKALTRYAEICLVVSDILLDSNLTSLCVAKLEAAMSIFSSNEQIIPLYHDTTWKGLVSTDTDPGADFGNGYYNDHHFHYAYFIRAAAIIGHIDPEWLTASNVAYVNTLVRDVANPSSSDPYFPVYRNFDWYAGHSWSKGLFYSGDGKDEESSSEDYNFAYGMKLWGMVSDDHAMHARGNLMLAVLKRYFLTTKQANSQIHKLLYANVSRQQYSTRSLRPQFRNRNLIHEQSRSRNLLRQQHRICPRNSYGSAYSYFSFHSTKVIHPRRMDSTIGKCCG